MNPRNLGDKQLFREDFLSTTAVSENGGVLTSATVSNGVMTCSGGGADYEFPEMDAFWELGGTIRMVIANDNVSASKRFFNYTAGSTNRSITFLRTLSTGSNFLQIRDGAGDNFYFVNIVSGQSTADIEFVMTWDPATTTITGYVDGGSATSDNSAGAQATTPDAVQRKLRVGTSGTGPWDGTIKMFEVYLGTVWTQEEVTDAFENDTYSEVDFGKGIIQLPLISQFNDGTQRTVNKGTTNAAITVGDGSTSSTFPTVKTFVKCFDFDGGDYVVVADAADLSFGDASTDSVFSVSAMVQMDDATDFWVLGKGANGGADGEYGFGIAGSDLFTIATTDASTSAFIGRQVSAVFTQYEGQWIHLAGTYDASEAATGFKLYLNGLQVDDSSITSGSYTAMEPLGANVEVGRFDDGTGLSNANGRMRDVALWDVELTPRQVRWLAERALKTLNK